MSRLPLKGIAKRTLIALAQERYDKKTSILKLSSDRYADRNKNEEYVFALLEKLCQQARVCACTIALVYIHFVY